MKLNNSPSGTPSWRKRLAISEWALSFMTSLARLPSTFAGDKRKILCGPDCEPDFLSPQPLTRLARSHASLPIFAFEDHICRVSDIIQRGLILDSIGEMPDLRQSCATQFGSGLLRSLPGPDSNSNKPKEQAVDLFYIRQTRRPRNACHLFRSWPGHGCFGGAATIGCSGDRRYFP